jgi:hypothetical protein
VIGFLSTIVGIKDLNEVELLTIIKTLELSFTRDDFFFVEISSLNLILFVVNWMNK